MTQTTARIKKGGAHFEILVDLEEALKVRNDEAGANLSAAVITEDIFHNLKSGDLASHAELDNNFGSTDPMVVAEKIIRSGEVVKTAESMKKEHEAKYKQIVDFLSRNAVSPEGRPYTSDRIMKALSEAHVNVKNTSIESQLDSITDQLAKVLPFKIEMKKVKLHIPAQHSGKAYGIVKEFMVEENWMNNGDLVAVVQMPTALIFDFYDRINGATNGTVLSEEMK